MSHEIPADLLAAFSRFVEDNLGLHFPEKRYADLERGLRAAADDLGICDPASWARDLMQSCWSKEKIELLAAHLTVGETYFLRDAKAFEALETTVIPAILRAPERRGRSLRVWSAACCTGEEPYSLALILSRMCPALVGTPVSILATDINPRFLQKACAGIYGRWSFRCMSDKIRDENFQQQKGDRWAVSEGIKKMVTFAPLNLVEDAYPSLVNSSHAMDIIFCRNVLMYFSRETAAKVIAKLRDSLVEGGWLFTSATDASRDLFVGMEPLEIEGTVIYQKRPPAAARSMAQPVEALPTRSVQVDQPTPRPLASAEKPPPIVAAPKPADPDHRKLAHRLANEGRLDEALEAVNRAINGDKLDASSYYLRGVILHEQGAHEEAVTSLRKALYLDPNFVIAHFALGNLMIRTGRGRDAQRCFDNVRALLRTRDRDAVLPESDGITAGRLLQILSTMQEAVA